MSGVNRPGGVLSTQMAKLRQNMLLLALVLAAVAGPEIIRYVGMVV